jgi:demethylmenaquinone methyltransferase/2-methoxy-6-polyprenyl-1,4-benzoquinol methylase
MSRPAPDEPFMQAAVQDMAAYYARRAGEYERIYGKPERQADLRAIERWLPDLFAGARALEIACGTAWWTPHAARHARDWLATDLNPETLAIARAKQGMPACVRFAEVDAYTMQGLGNEGAFDAAFAGFWWSHVPLARLPGWLALLHRRLAAGARVVFLDNRYVEGNSTPVWRRDDAGNTYQQRRLDDGSTHEVLKNFPARDEALALLGPRARDAQWIEHAYYWVLSYNLA